jgi:uncharacterized protein YcaQ
LSPVTARRLAILRQHLAGPRLPADLDGIIGVMRDIRYLQYDPMRIVAPSHLLVLWSRLGCYDSGLLDTLLWKERRLFEDWAQATSIVLTEDYSIFNALKQGFAAGDTAWAKKIRGWMEKNKVFSAYILEQLKRRGPLLSNEFEDNASENWSSTGWTAGRNIDMMLFFLKSQGKIMLAGRVGNQRLWDLTEHFLPDWVSRERLSAHEVARRAAQLSLRGLGIATASHIQQHFVRRCYGKLNSVLAELEAEERIFRVEVREDEKPWPGVWYVHSEDMPLLDKLEDDCWRPRTTLLSPFDNLISDRRRTEQLFGFRFRFEVYVPKPKREYGCYVMPILHGDRFIGRVDPVMNRKTRQLTIKAVYAEPNAPETLEIAQTIACAIQELGEFLEAKSLSYTLNVPAFWKQSLR